MAKWNSPLNCNLFQGMQKKAHLPKYEVLVSSHVFASCVFSCPYFFPLAFSPNEWKSNLQNEKLKSSRKTWFLKLRESAEGASETARRHSNGNLNRVEVEK